MTNRPRAVDVQTFLNEHPFSGFQWRILALCFIVVLLDGFDTATIGYIAPSLIKEWGVARSGAHRARRWHLHPRRQGTRSVAETVPRTRGRIDHPPDTPAPLAADGATQKVGDVLRADNNVAD